MSGRKRRAGALTALAAMREMAQSWAEDMEGNQRDMDHRDVLPAARQPFVLADILNMVNEVARQVGAGPPSEPPPDVRIQVGVGTLGGISQSFLISPGEILAVNAVGITITGGGEPTRIELPVNLTARLA